MKRFFEEEAFAVDCAKDVAKALFLIRTTTYAAVLVYEHLSPRFSIDLCTRIRELSAHTPLLCLLSKNDAESRISLFAEGADDYLSMPFVFPEILARLRAVWRRGPSIKKEVIRVAGLSLNTANNEVKLGGKQLQLSRKEFAVLELLMRNKGCVVSRMTIFDSVWNMDGNPLSNGVESHICSIRKKLGKMRNSIRNVQGRGYLIDEI